MKKKMLGSILGIVLMVGSFGIFTQIAYAGPVNQSIADDRIICNCTAFSNCKVSGSSGVCAQSQPGGNIQCSTYNSNC